jgi:hypothetical protein
LLPYSFEEGRALDLLPSGEVDGDERGDVGDRIMIGADEFALAQTLVQEIVHPGDALAPAIGQGRDLLERDRAGEAAILHAGRGVAQHLGTADEAVPFAAVLPHGDDALFLRGAAHQRRIGEGGFEIFAAGDGFRDAGPVVEFERRHGAEWIDAFEFGREMRAAAQIHRHDLDPVEQTFLRDEDAHAARARGRRAIIEFHCDYSA